MTFEEWSAAHPPEKLGEYIAAREAWDAAMEEASRQLGHVALGWARCPCPLCDEHIHTLRIVAQGLTSGSSPAPREEAPGAGSCAPGEPALGRQQEPE